MAIRRVLQIGDIRLKKENQIVTDFFHTYVASTLKDLKDTMRKTGLVGIAAPQIGKNIRIFITHPRNTPSRNIGKEDLLRTYINPKITHYSPEEVVIYEGCGSVAKGQLFGPVKRSKEITIEAFDEEGVMFELTADGLLARVIQHEYDHMYGIEYTEKITDYRKLVSQAWYRKNIRDSEETKNLMNITKIGCKKKS